MCSLLIFFSFSAIATDGRISQITATWKATRYSAATHEGNPLGTGICGGAFAKCGGAFSICDGAFGGPFSELRPPILRSASVLFVDFLFTSFLDCPSGLVFLCRQRMEDSL